MNNLKLLGRSFGGLSLGSSNVSSMMNGYSGYSKKISLKSELTSISSSPLVGFYGLFGNKRNFGLWVNDTHLGNLADNPGARKRKVRVGRGTGGGKGKTSGRGHKGQKSRAGGGVSLGFEGGQTPIYKRFRKYGFKNKQFKIVYDTINLERLRYFINKGRLDLTKKLTMKDLYDANCFKSIKHGVKLLGNGALDWDIPMNIEVSSVSESARAAIEKAGGSVTTAHYSNKSLHYLLKPENYDRPNKRSSSNWVKLKYKDGRFDDWGNPSDPQNKENKLKREELRLEAKKQREQERLGKELD